MEAVWGPLRECQNTNWTAAGESQVDGSCNMWQGAYGFEDKSASPCPADCQQFMKAVGPLCYLALSRQVSTSVDLGTVTGTFGLPKSLVGTLAAIQYQTCRAGKPAPGVTDLMWRKGLADVPACSTANYVQMSLATENGTGVIAGTRGGEEPGLRRRPRAAARPDWRASCCAAPRNARRLRPECA